jgi:hypothetical protein
MIPFGNPQTVSAAQDDIAQLRRRVSGPATFPRLMRERLAMARQANLPADVIAVYAAAAPPVASRAAGRLEAMQRHIAQMSQS